MAKNDRVRREILRDDTFRDDRGEDWRKPKAETSDESCRCRSPPRSWPGDDRAPA
jgi:hypothetical protein